MKKEADDLDKFIKLKRATSWEDFFYSLKKIEFNKEKYNEEIELIELEKDKFKGTDEYTYHAILLIITVKQKLIEQKEINLKKIAYFYQREQVDKLYNLVLNEKISKNDLVSSLFILDIETVGNNELSKPLLNIIRKYQHFRVTL